MRLSINPKPYGLGAKESLLLFWMKMGFSDVAAVKPTAKMVANPIDGPTPC